MRRLAVKPTTTISIDEGKIRTRIVGPDGMDISLWQSPEKAREVARVLLRLADEVERGV